MTHWFTLEAKRSELRLGDILFQRRTIHKHEPWHCHPEGSAAGRQTCCFGKARQMTFLEHRVVIIGGHGARTWSKKMYDHNIYCITC
uniref:Uncharacterized protein n=1 Tax=Mus musculus TaxID=10090 RepID=Q3TNP0_MOUSE|nr:unnamed protein product [Mus musculus]